jgi:hypothetical protein
MAFCNERYDHMSELINWPNSQPPVDSCNDIGYIHFGEAMEGEITPHSLQLNILQNIIQQGRIAL